MEPFQSVLAEGGKTNSLGRTSEVIVAVCDNQKRLPELIRCLSHHDAWIRMRAADALEKICRQHPEWIAPCLDELVLVMADGQASLQWHLAQIYAQITLTDAQRKNAIGWLETVLATTTVDWIVAAHGMQTLVAFYKTGNYAPANLKSILAIQQGHHSKSVVRKATIYLEIM